MVAVENTVLLNRYIIHVANTVVSAIATIIIMHHHAKVDRNIISACFCVHRKRKHY
jgi:hypothetical protein